MATRRTVPAPTLDERTRDLLLYGPWHVGLNLSTAPEHEYLRALWQSNEPALRAEAARRQIETPWFVDRDLFVRMLDGDVA